MPEVDAIILAAGLSRRMGAPNKLLLDWQGLPMIRHVVRTYVAAIGPRVTVVTGFEDDKVAAAVEGLPVQLRHNPDFENGQQSSVACALRMPSTALATFIGLGDQPYLTPEDLRELHRAHAAKDAGRISIPFDGTQRGNPIVIPAALRARLLEDRLRPGCKRFISENPALVQQIQLKASGFYNDIDTPDAYAESLKGGQAHVAT